MPSISRGFGPIFFGEGRRSRHDCDHRQSTCAHTVELRVKPAATLSTMIEKFLDFALQGFGLCPFDLITYDFSGEFVPIQNTAKPKGDVDQAAYRDVFHQFDARRPTNRWWLFTCVTLHCPMAGEFSLLSAKTEGRRLSCSKVGQRDMLTWSKQEECP